jgi:nucleoside-diphosphate-sugar epimerase
VTDAGPEGTTIVTGATGLVGRYLLPLLTERGVRVQAISRRPPPPDARAGDAPGASRAPGSDEAQEMGRATGEPRTVHFRSTTGVRWQTLDLAETPRGLKLGPAKHSARGEPAARGSRDAPLPERGAALVGFEAATVVIHAAPLWLLPHWLPAFAELGVRRLIAFSSTSRLTKESSRDARERATAARLAEAEEEVTATCQRRQIRWTIFRPTLIYGGGRDRNVSDIARVIARFGFFPIAGEGRGLRQPVHAEDLAAACLAALENRATFERTYEMPGGETLSYADMVCRVGRGLDRTPRLVHLPVRWLRGALRVASWLPGYAHLTPEMADRMNEDLEFDAKRARQDFGYSPRPFRFPDGEPSAGER